jgi:electron transport complex protein RnfC
MGYAQPDLDAPITRETDGVTVIPSNEVVPFSDAPCINCGRCVEVCPVFIPVNLVGRYAEFGFFEKAVSMGSGACVECGLCAYVCPSRRPLVQYMRFANKEYIQRQEESAQQEGE